jgi:membrane protein required for colicin V production
MAIFTPLFSGAVSDSALGGIDKGLGFIFGALRGALLVGVAYLLYEQVVAPQEAVEMVSNSMTHGFMKDAAAALEQHVPTEMPGWLESRVEALMGPCSGDGQSSGATSAALTSTNG